MWRIAFANNSKTKALANNKWVTVFREYERLKYYKSDMDFCVTTSVILDFFVGFFVIVLQQKFCWRKKELCCQTHLCLLTVLSDLRRLKKQTNKLKAKYNGWVQTPVSIIYVCIWKEDTWSGFAFHFNLPYYSNHRDGKYPNKRDITLSVVGLKFVFCTYQELSHCSYKVLRII